MLLKRVMQSAFPFGRAKAEPVKLCFGMIYDDHVAGDSEWFGGIGKVLHTCRSEIPLDSTCMVAVRNL